MCIRDSFGTDQFTIEFWIYLLKEPPVNKNIFARSTSASNTTGMIMWFDGNGHLEFDSIHGVSGAVHTGAAIGNHMWHHIAVTRDSSNNTRLYLNGVNKASASSDTSNIVGATNLQIASNIGADAYYNDAYISNFRMVKGTAIYSGTTDFTPPQSELTVVDGTILLCCQDSNDPTQEATDKTVTGFGNLATAGYLGTQPKVIPPYGVDAGNTFGGPIQQSSQGYMYFPTGRTEERGRGRVVIFGDVSTNEFFEMASGGITNVFGSANFTLGGQHASCSSTTRAVRMNGYSPSTAPIACNVMEFVTIATQSNATDFGDSTRACRYNTGFGSHTRGINANGNTPGAVNTIDFITIATTGDATDFGDLTQIDNTLAGSTSNSTRGLINGCEPGTNITEFVTIASTGNGQDFGDTTVSMEGRKGAASSTRALLAGGYSHPTFATINTIDFFTIATTGNATDFGDMTYVAGAGGGTSDSVRAVIMGGYTTPGNTTNAIDVVTIATTGDAIDFGDMRQAMSTSDGATSDSHGGLT